ncbi:MAG: hypothetical protein EPO31_08415 [Gammaproteobacteria bacterium]|jgi:hypothetical protein|nr:MAG: hypothetical protein EPO31_08415 [Gammaproteobacteria bacterium]
MGIPIVGVVTTAFSNLVISYSGKQGMPGERFAFVPHPITGVPAAKCRAYLEGQDPVTGKPVLDELVSSLTGKLTAEETATGFIERPIPRVVEVQDTEENLTQLFHNNGWTDGMPIVLPTEERVAAMLKGTSHAPDELVGKMQASAPHEAWSYTVEKVAVNAVMAGARPEHFPVILAIASTGAPALFTSTTSFARMAIINGPIRNQIGINSGIGALGPFSQANAVIGRAWTILSMNLCGGGRIGETYMGSQGNNFNYNNLTFGENEEQLPEGWKPLHVQKGYEPGDSVVSVFNGWGITHADQSFGKDFHPQIPRWLQFISPWSPAILLLDPSIIKQLKDSEGFASKEQLIDWIYSNTKVKAGDYWENYYSVQNFTRPSAEKGVEPYASWLKLPKDAEIPQFSRPERITVISVGGETNLFWQAGDFGYLSSASVDDWR